MKITKESKSIMVLKDRDTITFVVGILFILTGIIAIFKPTFFTDQAPFWLGFAEILIGGLILTLAKITTVRLDKSTGKLAFFQNKLTGQSRNEYNLKHIKEIELTTTYRTSNKEGRGYSYHVAFVFDDGKTIQLNPGSSSITKVMGQRIIPEKDLGVRIANFLNIPFQERRPPTVGESISAITSEIQNATADKKETETHKKL